MSIKPFFRWLLSRLYRVRVLGFEHYHAAGPRVLVVANHTSFLDAVLLWAFLPDELTFAISSLIVKQWWIQPGLRFAKVFPMDPMNPLSVKALTHFLKDDNKAVIFPEGRITVTGTLMKIYDGAGLIAARTGAMVLPIRIEGAQYTPFSRLHGTVRLRWFPPITLTFQAPQAIHTPPHLSARERRREAGQQLSELMSETMFASAERNLTLFDALQRAVAIHGRRHCVVEDLQRKPLSYGKLLAGCFALGPPLVQDTQPGDRIGVLLPNINANVVVFFGLQAFGRVPALLNFSSGPATVVSCCHTARIRKVLTSRRFIETARLGDTIAALSEAAQVVYLEDIAAEIGKLDRLKALWQSFRPNRYRLPVEPAAPAVVLFTSGSEGDPKGVVLSHANLIANAQQIAVRVDFTPLDTILNALPMFHAFGLTAGTLLPVLSGMPTFLYPSPLHYRIVPEIAYDIKATILFGTNTFLTGYGKYAHPYDFFKLRFVFAGAEKLQDATRKLWMDKFGVRIMEGYGATETAPVLSVNTPLAYREGTVGRLVPGMQWQLETVPGVDGGGRLHVRGPNVMSGYLKREKPGEIQPAESNFGAGWYDTGDVVSVDADGYVSILGRVKRFAKIGGEMVPLGVVEDLAMEIWPKYRHAVVAIADERKGEKLLLITEQPDADRVALAKAIQAKGYSELYAPREVRWLKPIPALATGKVDYPALQRLLAAEQTG